MPLVFPEHLQRELIAHARGDAPDEVCGILAGRDNRVEHVFRVRNTADDVSEDRAVFRDRSTGAPAHGRKAVHYYMDPRDQLRVYNAIDGLDLDVVGYYHSHTHTEARPSPTDVRLANDLAAYYVLISLQEAERPSIRAWRIRKNDPTDEAGELIEVEIEARESMSR